MAKKLPTLNKVPLEEVERLYHYCKSASQVAKILDVKENTLYQFKWKNKKEFSRLSAMREQGLLIDEPTEPKLLVNEDGSAITKIAEKNEKEIPLVINPVPENNEDYIKLLQTELEESRKTVDSQKIVIENLMSKEKIGRPKPSEKEIELQDKVDQLKKSNEYLKNRNKEIERIAENKPKLETQLLNNQMKEKDHRIKGMQVTIETSAKKVENQRKEIEKLTSALKDSEAKQMLMVKTYETKLENYQTTINKAAETNKIIRAELEKQEAQNVELVAENGEVKRQLELKDEMYQNAMNEVKRLDEKNLNISKVEEDNKVTNQALTLVKLRNTKLEEQIEELNKQIEGYQEEIHNMTTNAVPVSADIGQLSMELAFYKEHAIQYYNQLKGAN